MFSSQDPYLKYQADHFEVTVVSIGYRLAPEDPWPAGAEDCYDAAEWLVKNGPEVFGGELMFTCGEVYIPFLFSILLLITLTVCRRPSRLSRCFPPSRNHAQLRIQRPAPPFRLLRHVFLPSSRAPSRNAPRNRLRRDEILHRRATSQHNGGPAP